jgi:general secretion pathway protein E/type IV pilus assembly protein PilB
LRHFRQLNPVFHDHLCAHIKVLAQLDIAEKRLPQDGRLQFGIQRKSALTKIKTTMSV